jgi:hypothetical protein
MNVRDISNRNDLTLVQDSQDIVALYEHIGMHDYGCYFVKINEGEYTEVYGCDTFAPYLTSNLDRII